MKKFFKQKNTACFKKLEQSRGFTLIETMIAIAVFLIVVMIGMGALLNASAIHKKSQDIRSIMDNLSFVMEDMSRNLRTGYDYYCVSDGNFPPAPTTRSCAMGVSQGISFKDTSVDNSISQWAYKIEDSKIYKSTDGTTFGLPLNTDEIIIDPVNSGFTVTGAEPPGDIDQPYVTIRLVGHINFKGTDAPIPFNLQTSVSQRLVDR